MVNTIARDPELAIEILKLAVGALTPLLLALVGFSINRNLQRLAAAQWANQKAVEKRLLIFDQIAPGLNDLYCYVTFVGNWKELTPKQIVELKRTVDKTIYVNAALFPRFVIRSYNYFIHHCFRTYTGPGHDAKIRTRIVSDDGDRRKYSSAPWQANWDEQFVDVSEVLPKEAVKNAYFALSRDLSVALGLGLNPRQSLLFRLRRLFRSYKAA